jgi:hypothetical protein
MRQKEKWWPWRLQCVLLYGQDDSLVRPDSDAPLLVQIKTTDFCLWQGLQTYRLKEYLQVCKDFGMITTLSASRGSYLIKLAKPLGYRES